MHTTLRTLLAATTALTALAASAPISARELVSVTWIGSEEPKTPGQLSEMFSTARVRATYADGRVVENPLRYEMVPTNLARVGTNASPTGTLCDEFMRPIPDPIDPTKPLVSEEPDGSMLANIGGKLYLVNQFEYDWLLADGSEAENYPGWKIKHANGKEDSRAWNLPSTMVLTEVVQDPATGKLTPVAQRPIGFFEVGGLVWACNANTTPWGTFISSEENYSVDARQVEEDRKVDPSGRNDSLAGITFQYHGGRKLASPYWRGIVPEIRIGADGSTKVTKHFALGRGTSELVQIMPDQRTVLIAHDGENKAFNLFVADRPGDLSAGTLYAARLEQRSEEHGGSFDIRWIKLGHATNDEIRTLVDGGIVFSDIFETADQKKDGFVAVQANSSKKAEFLKVKNEKAAAFLETMRYAGYKGATVEFNKAEGLAYDPEGKRAFLAVSDISRGTLAGAASGDAGDHIRLKEVRAGAVYALPVAAGQKDSDGNPIDSAFVPVSMSVPKGLLGVDLAKADALGNKSDPNYIAGPDNLYWSSAYKTLFVGEDTSRHTANVLWAWQDGMEKPVRLLTGPAGAELTGLRIHENVGGHAYALTNAQHVGDFEPGDNETLKQAMSLIKEKWQNRLVAPLGYVSGMPVANPVVN